MTIYLAILAGVFGLAFGSFIGMAVYRVPRHESIIRPRSHCPYCNTELRVIDNIPLLSWILLGGRCRTCHGKISFRYPAAELLTALLFALCVLRLGGCNGCRWFDAVAFLPFLAALVVLSLIDLEHKLIPNRILYPFLISGFVLLLIAALSGPGVHSYVTSLIAAAISFMVFNVIHFISPSGMGYGDVRLSAYLGLYLGYLHPYPLEHVYGGFLTGFVLGSAVGVLLMLVGKAGRKTQVPFGPFLAAGAVISALWGTSLIRIWKGP
ncbi:MAG: prepilin peptidase [Actinomycetota bacterium]